MSEKIATHYANLQVAENAGPEAIKGAYKYLSQKWHPDKNPQDRAKAERISRMLNDAYATLMDPVKRREHDAYIAEERRKKGSNQTTANPQTAPTSPIRSPVIHDPVTTVSQPGNPAGGTIMQGGSRGWPWPFSGRGDQTGVQVQHGPAGGDVHIHYHNHEAGQGKSSSAERMRLAETVARSRTRFNFVVDLFRSGLASFVVWTILRGWGLTGQDPHSLFVIGYERWIEAAIFIFGPPFYAAVRVHEIRRRIALALFRKHSAEDLSAMREMGYHGLGRMAVTVLVVGAVAVVIWVRFM